MKSQQEMDLSQTEVQKDAVISIHYNISELLVDIFHNFPEYANNYMPELECTSYIYDKMLFAFYDHEEDKAYALNFDKIKKGAVKFFAMVDSEELNYDCDSIGLLDAGNWDAQVTMDLVQVCIFGETVYG